MGLTAQEIKQWARGVTLDREFRGKRVVIRNAEGKYLGRGGADGAISFTDDPALAFNYAYTADRVRTQIEQVESLYGAIWTPEEANPPKSAANRAAVTEGAK